MGLLDTLKTLTQNKSGQNRESPIPVTITNKRILIVEDDKMLADALTLKFKNTGYEVLTAENGKAGLELIATKKPDVILLDLMMPVMDGKSMLYELKQMPEFATIPVIVLTNAGYLENMQETKIKYDVKAFLIKTNINIDDVVMKVNKIVSQTPQQ